MAQQAKNNTRKLMLRAWKPYTESESQNDHANVQRGLLKISQNTRSHQHDLNI